MADRRVIRDFTTSDAVNKLKPPAFRFFMHLLLRVDDYGNIDAQLNSLYRELFPCLQRIRLTDIASWIQECIAADLITDYTHESKKYLHVKDFGQAEALNYPKARFPLPPWQGLKKKKEAKKKKEPEDEADVVVVVEGDMIKRQPLQPNKYNIYKSIFEYSCAHLEELMPDIHRLYKREYKPDFTDDQANKFFDKYDKKIWDVIKLFKTYNEAKGKEVSIELFKLWCARRPKHEQSTALS